MHSPVPPRTRPRLRPFLCTHLRQTLHRQLPSTFTLPSRSAPLLEDGRAPVGDGAGMGGRKGGSSGLHGAGESSSFASESLHASVWMLGTDYSLSLRPTAHDHLAKFDIAASLPPRRVCSLLALLPSSSLPIVGISVNVLTRHPSLCSPSPSPAPRPL